VAAPAPDHAIARGRAGAGLLAHIIVSKYDDHLPLYRAQPPDDGYMLARSVSDPNHKVQVRVEISFREIASLAGRPIELVIRDFIELTCQIIDRFDS
jgi:hypothetical protein